MDEHPGGGGALLAGAAPRPLPPSGGGAHAASPPPLLGPGGAAPPLQPPQGPAAPPQEGPGGGAELPRPQHYTIPGILHYIQHEWARFEMERAHWEVERAELQVGRAGGGRGVPVRARLLPRTAPSPGPAPARLLGLGRLPRGGHFAFQHGARWPGLSGGGRAPPSRGRLWAWPCPGAPWLPAPAPQGPASLLGTPSPP